MARDKQSQDKLLRLNVQDLRERNNISLFHRNL